MVLLWVAQIARGYSKRTWLTFRQAIELGGHVRKGEKACPVVYYGQATTKSDRAETGDDGEPARSYRFLKLFHVFNVTQIDDLPDNFAVEPAPPEMREPEAFGLWVKRAGARLHVGGAHAFYSPTTDTIHVPPPEAFNDPEQWNSTVGHEAVHFTGHPSRFDRLADYHIDRKALAREELIAEIGSAVLGAMSGFRPDHLEDHAAYISSWLDLVREEPRAFLSAAAKAQTAVDWLIERAGPPAVETRIENIAA
ncbi:MAG: hypothetical protein FD160_2439 [Caulobacteraceae bacterium]|nr:MAG: hypothetical protein FD160_2439 [Caulobacteraceae bacterium]